MLVKRNRSGIQLKVTCFKAWLSGVNAKKLKAKARVDSSPDIYNPNLKVKL